MATTRSGRPAPRLRFATPCRDWAGNWDCALNVHIGLAAARSWQAAARGHRGYTVTGDSVNLASRLTDAAAAGIILISDPVRHMLPPGFTCGEAGTLAVKGLAEPVRALRLLGIGAARGRASAVHRPARGARPVQGALGACRATALAKTIVVRGEAGIGKTRLVEELQALAEAAGFVCHTALVLDFGAGSGQDAIRALVRSLLGLGDEQRPGGAQSGARAGPGATRRSPSAASTSTISSTCRSRLSCVRCTTRWTTRRAATACARPLRPGAPGQHAYASAARGRGRALGGPGHARPSGEPRRHGRRLPGAPGHDLAHRGRSARPRLALQHRRQPLDDHRSRPAAPAEATAFAGAYFEANSELRPALHRARRRQSPVPRAAAPPRRAARPRPRCQARCKAWSRRAWISWIPSTSRPFRRPSIFGQRFTLDALRHALERPDYDCAASGRALPGPAGRRRLSVRPCSDSRRGLRYAAPRQDVASFHRRAADWFADARSGTARRASRSGRGSCGARTPISKLPAPRPQTTGTSAPAG